MNVNDIRDAMHNEPFKPFSLRLADGKIVNVPHPDFIAANSRLVIVTADPGPVLHIDPAMVISIEYLHKPRSRAHAGR